MSNYFEKADNIASEKITNEYAGMYMEAQNRYIVTKIQLQQHIDLEKKLLEIIKEKIPEIYKTLVNEEEGENGKHNK